MIEKRFTVPIKYQFSHSKIQLNGKPLTNDELVRILNTNDGAFVENFALKEEIEQVKKDRFICVDCEHSGYVEIGCLCEYNDHWQEHINECENFKELGE